MYTLNNGLQIPETGFGTYLLTEETTGGRTKEVILQAIECGYRYLDTAAFYKNEDLTGAAVRECGLPRQALFVATKVWRTELGYEKTKAALEASLQALDIGYIDLYLIHWPTEFPGDPDWRSRVQGSYRAIEEAVRAGTVKSIGLSNFLPHHIMAVLETAEILPVLDQLELHVGYMQPDAVAWCKKHEIQVQAWRPRGQASLAQQPFLKELAARYGVSTGALLLRFLLQQGIAVIPRSTSRAHMEENLHLPEFTIQEADFEFLKSLPPMGWSGQHPDFDRVAPVR